MNAVTWLGHATALIELDGARILTDPLLRPRLGHLRRHAPPVAPDLLAGIDAVVISHAHWDHLDPASLRALDPAVPAIVPPGTARLAGRGGLTAIELGAGESVEVAGARIEATPAAHSGVRPPFGPRATAVGYIIGGSARVYFAGDTGLFPAMRALSGVDLALLPVGGWGPWLRGGHLDSAGAAEALARIRPRIAVPIHWGTYWPIGLPRGPRFHRPGTRFRERAALVTPEVDVRVPAIGQRCAFEVAMRA